MMRRSAQEGRGGLRCPRGRDSVSPPAGGQSEAFLALTSLWSSLGGGEHPAVFFFFLNQCSVFNSGKSPA